MGLTNPFEQVRLTELVADAECRGELPPMGLSPGDLASSCRGPIMAELKAALALSRLVVVLEHIFHEKGSDGTADWQTRIHKAIYRVIIAGAALAGAYNEPIFAAKSQPNLKLAPGMFPTCLSAEQLEFLKGFTVCDMDATPEAEEAVFGPLSAWLLEIILSDQKGREAMAERFREGYGRARYCQDNHDCPVRSMNGGGHSDSHLVVWEIMQMLWALERIHDVVFRGESVFRESGTSARSALAVFFGVFHVEKVAQRQYYFDDVVPEARLACATGEETTVYRLDNGKIASGKSVAIFFSQLHGLSGWPEVLGPTSHGPLTLKFFTYFLRRHFGLRILPGPYAQFLRCPQIFSHDDIRGREPYNGRTADFLDGSEVLDASGVD